MLPNGSVDNKERIDGPTPNGGAYSIIYYKDANGCPCETDCAQKIVINEYDINDNVIQTTYAVV